MASLRYTTQTAFRSLRANRVRSALTILGIVIGITAIMLIVSIGQGARGLILSEIEGLGAETIVLRPGKEPKGPSEMAQTLFADSLKDRELDALTRGENVPELRSYAPVVFISEPVARGGNIERPSVYGWSAEFLAEMMRVEVASGQLFDETDIKQHAPVAVLGAEVAEELFPGEDPIGNTIRIRDLNVRVVAVLEKGNSGFFNTDKMVLLPYTTAMTYLSQQKHYNEIMLKVSSASAVDRSVEDIKATLRELHDIDDPEDDDFYIETQQGTIKQIGTILSVLTSFLSAVVAISLVVGGIGVMNVMLVSVTERTKEIGLRKAVGARDRDILTQFLIESVLLSLVGGVIGITLGIIFGFGASLALSAGLDVTCEFEFPLAATLLGVLVSAGVGIVFGIYPAKKAAAKSPIEALRYE